MSLYRTWRPKSFADLVGQDAVVRTLTTAIDTGRLAHAYLFSGPRGSGKTSAAKILARCIECVAGPTATPDNDCEHCRAIFAGAALDVLEIDAASNRGIDEIRALRDAVKFAPAVMRMKVYIIDEAHMLTKEGANAFLKTLEEPPPYAVFILATTAPEALPATILSRCQRYAFRRISIATMVDRMRTISVAEGIVIDDAALGAIAYRADGGLRDALTMLEQVAAFARGSIDTATVDAAFGQTSREFARRLMVAALDGDPKGGLVAIDEASEGGSDMPGLLRATIVEFRHLLVARMNPELLGRDLDSDDAARVLERSRVTPQTRLVRALRLFSDALAAARSSGNPRLEIETAMLRFILQSEDPSLDALSARLATLEASQLDATRSTPELIDIKPSPPSTVASPGQSAPTQPAGPLPTPMSSALAPLGELTLHRLRSLWPNITSRAASQKSSLKAVLSEIVIRAVESDRVTLTVPDRPRGELLRASLGIVSSAVEAVVGRPVDVRITVDNGRAVSASEPAEDPAQLMRYANQKLP